MFKTTQTDPYETEFGGTTEKRIQPKMSVLTVVLLGLMIALQIVGERFFKIETPITRISAVWLPRAICGSLLGPIYSAIVGGVADALGLLINPYPFNPLINLSAILRGATYGILLYRKHSLPRVIIASLIDQFFCGLIITTAGLCLFSGVPFSWQYLLTRLINCSINLGVELLVLIPTRKYLFGQLKQIIAKEQQRELNK